MIQKLHGNEKKIGLMEMEIDNNGMVVSKEKGGGGGGCIGWF